MQSSALTSAAEFSAVSVLPDTNLINLDPLRILIFEHMQEPEAQEKILEIIDDLAEADQLSRVKECVDIDNNNIMHEMVFTHESIIQSYYNLDDLYLAQEEYKSVYYEKVDLLHVELNRTESFVCDVGNKLKPILCDLLEALNDNEQTPADLAAAADNKETIETLVNVFKLMKQNVLEDMKAVVAEEGVPEATATISTLPLSVSPSMSETSVLTPASPVKSDTEEAAITPKPNIENDPHHAARERGREKAAAEAEPRGFVMYRAATGAMKRSAPSVVNTAARVAPAILTAGVDVKQEAVVTSVKQAAMVASILQPRTLNEQNQTLASQLQYHQQPSLSCTKVNVPAHLFSNGTKQQNSAANASFGGMRRQADVKK